MKRKYRVHIRDIEMSMTFFEVKAHKPARAICEVLRRKFLNLNTSDDRSIWEFAPKDNTKDLIRYLADCDIYAEVKLTEEKEKVLFRKVPTGGTYLTFNEAHKAAWKYWESRNKACSFYVVEENGVSGVIHVGPEMFKYVVR
jgi:hypothetical protein